MKHLDTRQTALLGSLLLVICLFAFNVLAGQAVRGIRLDLTEGSLYSLSPGVKPLLRDLDEPVRLDFYFSESAVEDVPQIRAYAQRVEEFLRELVQASGGSLELRRLDPEPFSEAEDLATAAGIAQLRVDGAGTSLSLGLAVVNSVDDMEVIPYLDPQDERFLEYEVVRAIVAVSRTGKARLGLLSGVDMGQSFDPQTRRQIPAWQIREQIAELFEIVDIEPTAETLPEDLDLLAIIHPEEPFSEALGRAVDDWALAGRPMLVAIDPWCEADAAPNPQMPQMPGQPTASRFETFLDAWGLTWTDGRVVGDRTLAQRVQTGTPQGPAVTDYVVWLRVTGDQLAPEDPVTGALTSVNLASVGAIDARADAAVELDPLITSTTDSQMIATAQLGFMADPRSLLAAFTPSEEAYILAARLRGTIESAYPEPATDTDTDPAPRTGTANIVLIGDVDFMANPNWIQEERLGPISLGFRVFADNGAFLLNALEILAGDERLASLRGRGEYARPFERVEAMRQRAEQEYLAEEQRLQDEIRRTEERLAELQRSKDPDSMLILSPEQEAEVDRLEEQMLAARRQLRAVQLQLREDVERVGTNLMVLNTIVWPLLVAAGASLFLITRNRLRRTEP